MKIQLHLLVGGAKGKHRFFRREMKGLIALVILCSLLVSPYAATKAQWHRPYGSYQWEGAEVQRLTYNSQGNKTTVLGMEEKLALGLGGAVSGSEKGQSRCFR